MCGRYYIEVEENEMQSIISKVKERLETDKVLKTGEIYPTNIAPVIRRGISGEEIAAVKWGFPKWDGGSTVINARAETVLEKNMFRKSIMERRCVIPSTGFYEWHRIDGKKQKDKYLIKRLGASMVYMAGAWNTFSSPNGDHEAFVILTTSSNDSMVPPEMELTMFPNERKPIHDRMPVILEPYECNDWLGNDVFAQLVLQRQGPELALSLFAP